ncbi:MAG: polyhydroxyalkanoate synthesis regulator DNA-binding domain-containing protein [Myxococcota bacterium]|nr:polyhydroxyalkanoate synthesis regulator DNA-binding domain-containing protein [Myxococcota bacterium]
MAILIKRYANRKLYNTQSSRYITLKGIAELLDAGEEVRVIDKQTGEDITSVALSQILVDSKRSNTQPPDTLLTQILGRGGDALYDALRKGVDDASEGIGDLQDRMRRMVGTSDQPQASPMEGDEGDARDADEGTGDPSSTQKKGFFSPPELDRLVQNAVERVFRLLDLPRRSDVESLNQNLERVAGAVEALEEAFAERAGGTGDETTDETEDFEESP